jgi:hypothetical protein
MREKGSITLPIGSSMEKLYIINRSILAVTISANKLQISAVKLSPSHQPSKMLKILLEILAEMIVPPA